MVMVLAYNVERTLEKTFRAVPDSLKPFVVVGDNCSTDNTPQVAARLGLRTVRHERNVNYGGNLKRLLRLAIQEGCDVAVELHGDFQYDPSLTDLMVEFISRGYFDMIQGNRIRSRSEALAGGMPLYRYLCNRTMTLGQNLWFGTTFGEWHSGLRAYSRRLIESAPLETFSDTHAFASDILVHAVAKGFWIGEVPCPARYDEESSSVPLTKLFDYAFKTCGAALRYPPGWRSPLQPMPKLEWRDHGGSNSDP
ncbi:MAG: glycosyltransferase family 2 protein [Planctomycetota bacterium]